MKTRLEFTTDRNGPGFYTIVVPKEVVDNLNWKTGDVIDIDIPMAGADVVLNGPYRVAQILRG